MANYSCLISTNNYELYPLAGGETSDLDARVIATGKYAVPLLWFGLFRVADIRTHYYKEIDEEPIPVNEPIVDVETALAHLDESTTIFARMFPGGIINGYFDMLAQAVRSAERRYLTMDMFEIATMGEPDEFYDEVRLALSTFDDGNRLVEGLYKMVDLSGIDAKQPIPSPRLLLDEKRISPEQRTTHSRIIGFPGELPVPWEMKE